MTREAYLDYSSTTPLLPEVRQAMEPFLAGNFGNPYSVQHLVGMRAHDALAEAKAVVCRILNVAEDNMILTSGATEANNTVIKGFAARYRNKPHHIFYGAIEHRSVTEPAETAQRIFGSVTHQIPVSQSGRIDIAAFDSALKAAKGPKLVCVMLANNEIPIRFPIEEIALVCKKHEAFLHCDAVQAFVREEVQVSRLGANSLVISPHKFYGPKGVGLLLLSQNDATPFEPLLEGGGQELGRRSGTTHASGAAGAFAAIQFIHKRRSEIAVAMQRAQDVFCQELEKIGAALHFVVPPNEKVPGLLGFYIEQVSADMLMQAIPHVCISRGATCSAGGEKYSHVPTALGLPKEVAANVLRASFGFFTSEDEARYAAQEITSAALSLRRQS